MNLPAWAKRLDNGEIGCTRCGGTAEELPVQHSPNCIYRLDIVA